VANLPAPTVPPGFLPRAATTAVPPLITIDPPPRTWPASPITYVRREVGARVAGTHGAPRAALRWEVGHWSRGGMWRPPELPRAGQRVLEPRGHMAPLEPPRAWKWTLEPRGHVAPSELPCVERWVPEPRGHVVPPELPCSGRWEPEPR
jgi:hypothetical protein